MKRITVALLLCTLWNITANAQKTPLQNINSDPHENPCIISFGLVSKLITIEATVNGITGYLCIDSGMDGLVIRDKYFQGKSAGMTEVDFKSLDGKTINSKYADATIQFDCVSMDFKHARVVNLDHLIKNESTRVLGLVGLDVFRGFELQIDFRNKLLCLYKLDGYGRKMGAGDLITPPIQTIPFQFKGSLLFIEAKIGSEHLNLILDTGASVNVMRKQLYKRFTSFSKFLKLIRLRTLESTLNDVPLTEVTGLMIENIPSEPMKTIWYDLSSLNLDLEGPEMDGVLGQELMKQYLLGINFKTSEVSFYAYEDAQLIVDINQVTGETPAATDY